MVRYESDAASEMARVVFADGTRQRVTLSRERRYPGLGGTAPDTTEAYGLVAARLLDLGTAGRVVDLGAGAGAGTALLSGVGLYVTAVEPSREAVDFLRGSGTPCELVHGGVERAPLHDACAVVLVDVLGLVPDDVALLRQIARGVRRDTVLLGAVARADLDRPPTAPARHGFTVETLRAALLAAGFEAPTMLAMTADLLVFETSIAARRAVTDALCDARAASTPEAREEALAVLAEALREECAPATAHEGMLAIGDLQLARADHAAEEAYAAANAIVPDAARPYVGLAAVRSRAGATDDARALLDHALALDPTHAPAWHALAQIHAADGDLSAAVDCLAHAASLAPSDAAIAGELARRRRQLGDTAGALDALARLLPYGTCHAAMRGTLGGMAFASGPAHRPAALLQ